MISVMKMSGTHGFGPGYHIQVIHKVLAHAILVTMQPNNTSVDTYTEVTNRSEQAVTVRDLLFACMQKRCQKPYKVIFSALLQLNSNQEVFITLLCLPLKSLYCDQVKSM